MSAGGARPGAGRKRGSTNLRTREIADRIAADGLTTPLEYLVEQTRKPYPEGATPEVMAAYDAMRLEAAKAVGPHLHPRLQASDAPVQIGPLVDTLTEQGRAIAGALGDGRLTPDQASRVMATISAHARLVEIDELEKCIAALEAKQ